MSPNQRLVVGGVVVVSASLAGFIGLREGTRLEVYADVGGIPTVCDGVVVRGVAIGTKYTRQQCDAMTAEAIKKHGLEVLACTKPTQLKQHEYDAVTSLAYNVGTDSVCATCLPGRECLGDLLRAGKMRQACDRILAYAKVRIQGALRDCSDPQWNCRGVWLRRQAEQKMCLGEA